MKEHSPSRQANEKNILRWLLIALLVLLLITGMVWMRFLVQGDASNTEAAEAKVAEKRMQQPSRTTSGNVSGAGNTLMPPAFPS